MSPARIGRIPGDRAPLPGSAAPGLLLGVCVWLAGACYFFRDFLCSGFRMIFGDEGDQRLLVFLHEHWFLVLRGKANWLSPDFFFPVKGALGYTEAVFLNVPIYAFFRFVDAEPFLAYQLTLIALNAVGFLTGYWLLRSGLGEPVWLSVAAAMVFAFASNLRIKYGHSQLYAIYYVPLILLLMLRLGERVARPRPATFGRHLLAFSTGLALALLLYTSLYIGVFLLIFLVLLAASLYLLQSPPRSELLAHGRRAMPSMIGGAAGFAIGIVPFLVTYLPVLASQGSRSFGTALDFMGYVPDVVNPGIWNVWGPVLRAAGLWPESHLGHGEIGIATPPILYIASLAALVISLKNRGVKTWNAAVFQAGILSALVMSLLSIKVGVVSPWLAFHLLFPGAAALRAVHRIQLMVSAILALSIPFVVPTVTEALRARLGGRAAGKLGAAVLVVLLILEQVNFGRTTFIDREDQMALLGSIPPAGACTSFFISQPRSPEAPFYVTQIDAMLIAQRLNLPTINGYSGHFPPGWRLLHPEAEDYEASAREWLEAHRIEGACALDLKEKTWRLAVEPREPGA